MIGAAVHEVGHELGLMHTWQDDIEGNDNDPNNYMSYRRNDKPVLQIEQLRAIYAIFINDQLNKGSNTEVLSENSYNYGSVRYLAF